VNGRELTADDVKYTYDRFLQLKGNPNRSTLSPVERIDVLDRSTVKFTLTEPSAGFSTTSRHRSPGSCHARAVEHFGDLRRAEACIGTGPWMLERYEPNTRLTFVRNKDYFIHRAAVRGRGRSGGGRGPSSRLRAGSPAATTSRPSTGSACAAWICPSRASESRAFAPRTSSCSSAPLRP